MVEPITKRQQSQVVAETSRYIEKAEGVFGRRFERIPVVFDLQGTVAGMFKALGRERWIRYNPWIFSKYYAESLGETVPHEVAHYVVHEAWGGVRCDKRSKGRALRPHGEEWRTLMDAFGAQGEVTFNLNLDGIPRRRQARHTYRCGCRTHQVSTTRHNRTLKGAGRYHCRNCDGLLVYCG